MSHNICVHGRDAQVTSSGTIPDLSVEVSTGIHDECVIHDWQTLCMSSHDVVSTLCMYALFLMRAAVLCACSEAAYASLTQELDRLCDLASAAKRRRLAEAGFASGAGPGMAAAMQSSGAAGSGQTGAVLGGRTFEAGSAKSSRFKALSVEVPHQTVSDP